MVDRLFLRLLLMVFIIIRKSLIAFYISFIILTCLSSFLASYCASKHAVIGYTRSFELMPQICNVRVNAICPFWIGKLTCSHMLGMLTHYYECRYRSCHTFLCTRWKRISRERSGKTPTSYIDGYSDRRCSHFDY